MSIPQHIVCPITHQIFCNPVTIDDGYTYEKQAIEEWLKNHNTSPMAKNIINTKIFTTNIIIKTLVEEYLLKNPDEKKEQYEEIIIKHVFNWREFEILNVAKQKEYLDNCIDLECKNNDDWRPIHFICQDSTPEMIKYIINKNVDLECETVNKTRPIHLICKYSTPEMIKFIIEKKVDLECKTKEGWRPIHLICKYSPSEMIKFIIEKGVELECETSDGWRPIHYICRFSTSEMIKFIIENGIDLECETSDGWRPIHIICRFSTLDVIEYASLKCDLTVKISKYGNETVNYDINDLIKLNPLATKQYTMYYNIKTFFNNTIFSK